MDTLSTLDTIADGRRYLELQPAAAAVVAFLKQTTKRAVDADGLAMELRIVRAVLAATTDLAPVTGAPLGQVEVYRAIRRAAHFILLQQILAEPAGSDGPLLNASALVALASIEVQDPVGATPVGRPDALLLLLGGLSWRADLGGTV